MGSIAACGQAQLLGGGALEALLDRRIAENGTRRFALCVVGVNRFRRINQLLGFTGGDQALQEISSRILAIASQAGVAAHLGGDEFAILLEARSRRGAERAVAAILEALGRPLVVQGHEFHMTASLGLALYPASGADGATLLRRAASAMLRAKQRSGNAVEWSPAAEPDSPRERFQLENALHRAVERNELRLRYQPEVDREGHVRAVEALLVWDSADLGHVDTETLVRLAEETGIITAIGEWVLREACLQAARWLAGGRRAPCIAVNVSPQQFSSPQFVASVRRILEETGLPGQMLELEVTESCILADIDQSARRMAELRKLGVRIAIDDFGVGYSPLAYLHRLPLDKIKVDRSFVRQIAQPGGTLPVVHTITVLAHHRGLQVVAEGVETAEQFELVHAARCDLVQGFFVGMPLAEQEIAALLADQTSLARYAVAASHWSY
ncbi:MAG: bifunctional diguanylate cyclase/phosphodiesterase [Bryobacteraceae bacterium]|nr:bifunctional diguanylate cyclase/phosphodiesterase [Bryobacteraceae bacterium]MCX7603651.1 bifunctional diguanylate cyclase/phosphodiesterase [Bryobacteraceae bacterium]